MEEPPADPSDQKTAQSDDATLQLPVVRAKIAVTGSFPDSPAHNTVLDGDQLHSGPVKDAGDLLRVAPGVSSGRMGGHGLDPRVRGLGESGIRVLVDGAEIHGGCPNRMDPPSSFAAVESFDEISVARGVQTLRYGNAPGTVLFERNPVRFTDEGWWRAAVSAAGGTNNDGPALGFNAAVGSARLSLRASADRVTMNSYSDGDGNEVASAYDSRNGSLALGWTPDPLTSLSLSWEANRTRDALFAGAGMDSPFSNNDAVRLKLRRDAGPGVLGEISADAYWSDVEHLMDNYSLRDWTAATALRAPSTSESSGVRFWSELQATGSLDLTVGLDVARNAFAARRFAGPNPDNVAMLQSVLWPEVELDTSGLFVEGEFLMGHTRRIRFGIRGDRHTASAGAADAKPGGPNPTPRGLWESYYETVDDTWETTNLGGFLRYEHQLERSGIGVYAGVSRTARAADTTQRYMAANSSNPMMRWVGSPNLDVATHVILDAGSSLSRPGFQIDATVFYDDVDNEILRDRAHGQPGILKSDGATIYRNIEAYRTGLEISGRGRLGSGITIGGDAAYVYAQNSTDGRPLAQTPPLEGRLYAGWARGRWGATGTVRWAATQTRVDDDPKTGSGLDAAATPDWAVLDLSGEWEVGAGLRIVAGIDNTLDATYAYHLNSDNAFDPIRIQINEPGRVFWVRLRWNGGDFSSRP
jgi:iron complex outermembrane receptor protein